MEQKNPSVRIGYIDKLRGWATISMCFVHTYNVILADELKKGWFYETANFYQGLIAPAFLFSAAAAITVNFKKKKDDIMHFGPGGRKSLRRFLQILFIAYFMHLPFKTLKQCLTIMDEQKYLMFIQSDILQVISLGLIFMFVLYIVLRGNKNYIYILGFVAIAIIPITQLFLEYDFGKILPIYLATFFNKVYHSGFPLFPWLAYLFLGAFVMDILSSCKDKTEESQLMNKMSIIAVIVIILSYSAQYLGWIVINAEPNSYARPALFLVRFSFIILILNMLRYLENFRNYRMKLINVFCRESLLIYVLHLYVIYGSVFSFGFSQQLGHDRNWGEIFIVTILLAFSMWVVATIWNTFKTKRPKQTRIFLIILWSFMTIYFLVMPF